MRRAAIGAVASLAGACSILTSFDGIEPRSPIALVDGAPDAAADAAADAACVRTRWPDPPQGSDTPVDVGELTSAVTQLRILEPLAEGKILGFDLDGLCTCPDRPACIGATPVGGSSASAISHRTPSVNPARAALGQPNPLSFPSRRYPRRQIECVATVREERAYAASLRRLLGRA